MRKLQRLLNFLSLISVIICLASILVWMVAAGFKKGRRTYHWTDQPRLVLVTIDVDFFWRNAICHVHAEYEERIGPARPTTELDATRRQLMSAIGPPDQRHTDWITPQYGPVEWYAVAGAKLRIGRATDRKFWPGIVTQISFVLLALSLVGRHYVGKKLPKRAGYCVNCDYDLRGNITGICPECGAQVTASRSSSSNV